MIYQRFIVRNYTRRVCRSGAGGVGWADALIRSSLIVTSSIKQTIEQHGASKAAVMVTDTTRGQMGPGCKFLNRFRQVCRHEGTRDRSPEPPSTRFHDRVIASLLLFLFHSPIYPANRFRDDGLGNTRACRAWRRVVNSRPVNELDESSFQVDDAITGQISNPPILNNSISTPRRFSIPPRLGQVVLTG